MANLRVNRDRLWKSLMDMARIGATEKGGVCRLALTELDRESRDLFGAWCRNAGCGVTVDQFGNIFARRSGRDDTLAPVMTGSHLDGQPTGGKFDGAYGVLAGLEVLRTLNDADYQTEAPIEVVVWTNEEGSRFSPPMIGSGVFAGLFDLDYARGRMDADGRSQGEALEAIGYAGEATVGGRPVGAYFEAHIEQGPILEGENKVIGAVTGAQGQRWYSVMVRGEEAHAGTTPMPRRKDALLGAARLVAEVNRIALAHAPHACGTVGVLRSSPNSRNVIPGSVALTVDLRHPDDRELAVLDAELRRGVQAIADENGLEIEIEQDYYTAAVPFDDVCIEAVRAAAKDCGYTHRDIISGAGHDAVNISRVAPTGMIFIPCEDGISHNERENVRSDHIVAGCNVLLDAMVRMADRR